MADEFAKARAFVRASMENPRPGRRVDAPLLAESFIFPASEAKEIARVSVSGKPNRNSILKGKVVDHVRDNFVVVEVLPMSHRHHYHKGAVSLLKMNSIYSKRVNRFPKKTNPYSKIAKNAAKRNIRSRKYTVVDPANTYEIGDVVQISKNASEQQWYVVSDNELTPRMRRG